MRSEVNYMNQNYTKLLGDILKNMAHMDHIRPAEIPDIDLYMDQVTSFMNDHLKNSKRFDDDKILTKTMINNYAKNKLLPPPEKKRYTKEHMYLLIFIYYMKGFLSLSDIQTILQPVTDRFASGTETPGIEDIYAEVYRLGKEHIAEISRDIMESFHTAANSLKDYDGEERDTLQLFNFICLLSFDIYLRKEVIERLIDGLSEDSSSKKGK